MYSMDFLFRSISLPLLAVERLAKPLLPNPRRVVILLDAFSNPGNLAVQFLLLVLDVFSGLENIWMAVQLRLRQLLQLCLE